MNLFLEIIPGLFITFYLNDFLEKKFISLDLYDLISGNYFIPSQDQNNIDINYLAYFKQLLIWLFIVFVMKISIFSLQIIFFDQLKIIIQSILYIFKNNMDFKLIFVMIIYPFINNSIQFWICDNILKKKVWFNYDIHLKKSFYQKKNLRSKFLSLKVWDKKEKKFKFDNKNKTNTLNIHASEIINKNSLVVIEEENYKENNIATNNLRNYIPLNI